MEWGQRRQTKSGENKLEPMFDIYSAASNPDTPGHCSDCVVIPLAQNATILIEEL